MAELTVYQRPDARWAWRLKADNGVIVATNGGDSYVDEASCQFMADQVVVHGEFRNATPCVQPAPIAVRTVTGCGELVALLHGVYWVAVCDLHHWQGRATVERHQAIVDLDKHSSEYCEDQLLEESPPAGPP